MNNASRILRLAFRNVLLVSAVALTLCASAAPAGPERFAKAIDEFTESDKASPPAKGGILFIGSSTIRMWNQNLAKDFPGLNVIGRGYGGSKIADSVFYAGRIVLPYAPRMIVFYAGENDIAAKVSAQDAAAHFAQFCDIVLKALPDTRILYVSMKPSPRRWNIQQKFDEANALIAAYCARTFRTAFLDMKPHMLGADGQPRAELFTNDKLHMNAEGYKLWRSVIAPLLAPETTTVPAPPAAPAAGGE